MSEVSEGGLAQSGSVAKAFEKYSKQDQK
jgi:hypothetical protein